jgi:glutaredoxin 3
MPARKQMNITIYSKANCPNCVTAKQLLKSKDIRFGEVDVEKEGTLQALTTLHPSIRQMPAIFIDGQHVGGLAGLQAALKELGL